MNVELTSQTPGEKLRWLEVGGNKLALHATPRLRQPSQLAGFTDRFGQNYWILKNPEGNNYLSLDQAELFYLERMDGQRTVATLNMEYLQAHRALGDRLLSGLLIKLQTRGFLREPLLELETEKPKPRPWWSRLWQTSFSLGEIDPLATRLYQRVGWILFTPLARLLLLSVVVSGLVVFILQIWAGGGRYLYLHTFSGPEVIGLWLPLPLCMILHESAHMLACKAHGLRVGRLGVIIGILGIPAPYVNTNDTWMAPQKARMMVSAAGPFTNLFIAGLCAALAYSYTSFQPFLLRLSALNYLLTFINLNPWTESDGYLLLMDYLRVPGLRASARKFMRTEFPHLIRRGWQGLTDRQRIFAAYWVGSFLYSAIISPINTWVLAMSVYRLLVASWHG